MKNKNGMLNIGNIFGIISLCIPIVIFILILNWFFEITPYQRLEGFPLMITPCICPIGIVLAIISSKISINKFWRIGIIFNVILMFLPVLYWYVGTLFFGV